jgi:hypothetical protein
MRKWVSVGRAQGFVGWADRILYYWFIDVHEIEFSSNIKLQTCVYCILLPGLYFLTLHKSSFFSYKLPKRGSIREGILLEDLLVRYGYRKLAIQ